MLFTYLLVVAMLALPNTLLLRCEFTCLISLMQRRQHSTGQPVKDTCQWWNTWSKVLDLMSKTRTRSVCKYSSLMIFSLSFLHGYLYSVKCHTVLYTHVLQSYFCSLMTAVRVNLRGLHLPFGMQLQEATSEYVCNYNCLIHQHCLQALVYTTVVHMCCECASFFLMCSMVRLPF